MKLSKKTALFLLSHRVLARYLGLAIILWFLSGIVMVFISYPRLDYSERVEFSGYLQSTAQLPKGLSGQFTLESIMGRPMIRKGKSLVNASIISKLELESRLTALGKSEFKFLEKRNMDQWTLQGKYHRHRPFFIFENSAAKQLYISSKTGELVLLTSLFERLSNYLGTVTHWIYFPVIRSRPSLWNDIVIYLSMFAFFMTLGGFYKGIKLFSLKGKYRKKRKTPFWGVLASHHYWGVFFGVFCLTWLFSGFLSMNPFGMFSFPRLTRFEKELFEGELVASEEFNDLWRKSKDLIDAKKPWRVKFRSVNSKPIIDLYSASGITHTGGQSPQLILAKLKEKFKTKNLISFERLDADDYFLSMRKLAKRDEVWRFKFQNGHWLDIGLKSSRVIRKHNLDSRIYRVAFDGLHRLWLPGLHTRPNLRKLLVVVISLSCLFFIASGLYSYYRRLSISKYLKNKMLKKAKNKST